MRFEDFLAPIDSAALARALDQPWWRWAMAGRRPVGMTLTGDVFLAAADGAVYFLDTNFGVVERIAEDQDAFGKRLQDEAFARSLLRMDIVLELDAHGFRAAAGQCFAFAPQPVLGEIQGARAVAFESYLDFMGQLLERPRELRRPRRRAARPAPPRSPRRPLRT